MKALHYDDFTALGKFPSNHSFIWMRSSLFVSVILSTLQPRHVGCKQRFGELNFRSDKMRSESKRKKMMIGNCNFPRNSSKSKTCRLTYILCQQCDSWGGFTKQLLWHLTKLACVAWLGQALLLITKPASTYMWPQALNQNTEQYQSQWPLTPFFQTASHTINQVVVWASRAGCTGVLSHQTTGANRFSQSFDWNGKMRSKRKE